LQTFVQLSPLGVSYFKLDAGGYLVIDSIDGKAHYVALPPKSELEQYPMGAVVEVKRFQEAVLKKIFNHFNEIFEI